MRYFKPKMFVTICFFGNGSIQTSFIRWLSMLKKVV